MDVYTRLDLSFRTRVTRVLLHSREGCYSVVSYRLTEQQSPPVETASF